MDISTTQWIDILVGVVLPIIVAAVMEYEHSGKARAVVLLFLSGVTGFLNNWLSTNNFDWHNAVLGSIITFVIGVAALFGLWKPTEVNERAKKFPNR